MNVMETNVDFILISPDKSRLNKSYQYLVRSVERSAEEMLQENTKSYVLRKILTNHMPGIYIMSSPYFSNNS